MHYSMEVSVAPELRVYIELLSGGFIQHKYLLQHSAVEGLNSTTEKGFFAPGWMVHITLQLRGIILDYKVKGLFHCMFACWWLIVLMSADRQTDKKTYRLTDRQAERHTDRQTDILTYRQYPFLSQI